MSKRLKGARMQPRAQRARDIRPYDMRVSRDHGGGLWTIESDSGQLYLAVLSPLSSEIKAERERERRVRLIDSSHPEYVASRTTA